MRPFSLFQLGIAWSLFVMAAMPAGAHFGNSADNLPSGSGYLGSGIHAGAHHWSPWANHRVRPSHYTLNLGSVSRFSRLQIHSATPLPLPGPQIHSATPLPLPGPQIPARIGVYQRLPTQSGVIPGPLPKTIIYKHLYQNKW